MTMCDPDKRRDAIHHLGEWYLYFGKLILLATVIWIILLIVAE